ncbi:MAG: TolC family protein, partial [Bacteroidota bacterium]|nr:TolC family protein [Bacteroidota bacterium]
MNQKYFKLILILLSAGVLMTSCGGINRTYQRPDLKTDGLYRDINTADSTGIGSLPWKTVFNDPDLQNLIQEGLSKNIDLLVAIERVKEAEATLTQSNSALYPSLNAGVNAVITHSKASSKAPQPGYSDITLSSSWEIDLWGKLRSN